MLIDFYLLTLLTIWCILLFILNNEKNKVGALYSLVIIMIFYTPNLYFILGGESYRFFDEASLQAYIYYSSFVMLIYALVYSLVYGYRGSFKGYKVIFNSSFLIKLYLGFVVGFIFIYYAYFFKSFPTVHFILSGELIERPDLTGSIPFFFTVSTIAFVVLPSAYFFYFNKFSTFQHILANLVIVLIFVMGGNKGLVVFYFIFLWLFVFKLKIDLRVITLFILSIAIYMLTKGITEINSEVIDYLASSPFRRFFVTQGTCFLFRIDMLSEGYTALQADPRGIKFDVFSEMYNTDIVGSCPTFVTGDLLVKYGYMMSLTLFIVISLVVLILSKWALHVQCNKKLFLYWNIYFVIFIIVMSGLESSNLFRIVFVVCNLLVIYVLSNIKIQRYL